VSDLYELVRGLMLRGPKYDCTLCGSNNWEQGIRIKLSDGSSFLDELPGIWSCRLCGALGNSQLRVAIDRFLGNCVCGNDVWDIDENHNRRCSLCGRLLVWSIEEHQHE
jgi:hypothetical protein